MDRLLTVEEVSEIFGVDNFYVTHTLCNIKGFPYIKIKRRYFFDATLLKEWIVKNQGLEFL